MFVGATPASANSSDSPTLQPAYHPPSPPPLSVLVRPQHSPSQRVFTTEMAAKVCRSVLLLSRSRGAVATSLPALIISSQRHNQHIRPVSLRTFMRTVWDQAGRRGYEAVVGCTISVLCNAKQVKLTSIFDSSIRSSTLIMCKVQLWLYCDCSY